MMLKLRQGNFGGWKSHDINNFGVAVYQTTATLLAVHSSTTELRVLLLV